MNLNTTHSAQGWTGLPPLPWHRSKTGNHDQAGVTLSYTTGDGKGRTWSVTFARVHFTSSSERDAEGTADTIIQAVQAHDALIRALETISGWSKCQCSWKHGDNPNCCISIADAALKVARGEA